MLYADKQLEAFSAHGRPLVPDSVACDCLVMQNHTTGEAELS